MTENTNLHIAVVGGGAGGYAAAFLAADIGLKVTLIDPEVNPGGVCLYRGCIPSKALLHVAKLIEESHQAKNWGIEFADPKVDLGKLRGWKESVVQRLTGVGTLDRSVFSAVARVQLDFGLGKYHNRGVIDGFGGVSRGREQWTVGCGRR